MAMFALRMGHWGLNMADGAASEIYLYIVAAIMGLVEGLTEFIPVSSTGHLILVADLLKFNTPVGEMFEVVIQLGAILAICWMYRSRFTHILLTLFKERASQRFVTVQLLAFLPAMIIGGLAYGFIKRVLFSPWVVAVTLIVGGIAIWAIERRHPAPRIHKADEVGPGLAIKIGLCQCLAMIPGVSRSGATIMGAMLMGVGRTAATEFSFFLAVPTMLAATVYDFYKNWSHLQGDALPLIGVGFVVAFFSALVVVRTLIAFVSKNGFTPFAYYRIAIGLVMLAVLMSGGMTTP